MLLVVVVVVVVVVAAVVAVAAAAVVAVAVVVVVVVVELVATIVARCCYSRVVMLVSSLPGDPIFYHALPTTDAMTLARSALVAFFARGCCSSESTRSAIPDL